MKKLLCIITILIGMASLASADTFVGYTEDGCPVFFQPYYGYYETCYQGGSWAFLGTDFGAIRFRETFHREHHHGFFSHHHFFGRHRH